MTVTPVVMPQTAQLEKFTMRGTQLLSSGRTMDLLSRSGGLGLHVKVYAEGGENSLHAHDKEEHAFFVLAGEATFTGEDGTKTVVRAYDGMMVPKDTYYMFHSSGDENLVLLRIGSQVPPTTPSDSEPSDTALSGTTMTRHSIDGNTIKNVGQPVVAPGEFFGL